MGGEGKVGCKLWDQIRLSVHLDPTLYQQSAWPRAHFLISLCISVSQLKHRYSSRF